MLVIGETSFSLILGPRIKSVKLVIKENRPILVPHYNIGSPKLWGAPLLRGGAYNKQNTVPVLTSR